MMTREKAIEVLENGGWWDLLIPITTIEGRVEEDRLHEALDLALAALHPVSRERVEKVWRGEWEFPIFTDAEDGLDPRVQCSACGNIEAAFARWKFCPNCGAAITDEAVEMTMKRMKVLRDDN